jgi:hypothetical protein
MAKLAIRPVHVALIGGILCSCVIVLLVRHFVYTRFFRGAEAEFADQHLKTTVALLELHRVRNGSYPATLGDLKYVGDWDHEALNSVRYCPSSDRTNYYVEVTRAWIGRPKMSMPADFWHGTGYRAELAKDCP